MPWSRLDAVYAAGFQTKISQVDDAARGAIAALGRQALHAAVLGFDHPVTGQALSFASPLPADLEALAAALRAGATARSQNVACVIPPTEKWQP